MASGSGAPSVQDAMQRAVALLKKRNMEAKQAAGARGQFDVSKWAKTEACSDILAWGDIKFLIFKAPLSESRRGGAGKSAFGSAELKAAAAARGVRVNLVVGFASDHPRKLSGPAPKSESGKSSGSQDRISWTHLPCPDTGDMAALDRAFNAFRRLAIQFLRNSKAGAGPSRALGLTSWYGAEICMYMAARFIGEEFGVSASAALAAVAKARPPGVKSRCFLDGLYRSLGEEPPKQGLHIAAPVKALTAHSDPNGIASVTSSTLSSDAPSLSGKTPTFQPPKPRKMPRKRKRVEASEPLGHAPSSSASMAAKPVKDSGLSGHKYLVRVKGSHLARLTAILWKITKDVWPRQEADLASALRGASLEPAQVDTLKTGFRVTWMPEGTSFALLILKEGCFLVGTSDSADSQNVLRVFHVPNLEFRKRKRPDSRLGSTVALCDLVRDVEPNGAIRPRLLLTDILVIGGTRMVNLMHSIRLRCANVELVACRHKYASLVKRPPVSLRVKKMFKVEKWREVLEFKTGHRNIGLRFVQDASYSTRQGDLRWERGSDGRETNVTEEILTKALA